MPDRILDFINEAKVGQLSVRTEKGVLVHPIAYYCDNEGVVFGTPKRSAKLKWIQKDPRGAFTVDNGKLMKENMGITVFGNMEIYGHKTLFRSLISAFRATYGFHKKYPELLKSYIASVDELSEEQKLYKYVFIRLNPNRVIYWDGNDFGQITSKTQKTEISDPEKSKHDPVIYAKQVMDYYKSLESLDSEIDEDISLDHLAGDLFAESLFQNDLEEESMDVMTLLSLPEHLRKAGISVHKLKKGTVDEIAEDIGSTSTQTKYHLDRLTLMKLLKKEREDDQMAYFYK